jgi:hypothetical protein
MRKGLLGDLSSLVKTSKKLQDTLQTSQESIPVFGQLDELVLKAFKLVTRAVRFLDVWAQDAVSLSFELGDASTNRPLTPPSDAADPSMQPPATSNHDDAVTTPANQDAPVVPQASANATREETDSATQPPRNLNPRSCLLLRKRRVSVCLLRIACRTPESHKARENRTLPLTG